MRTIAVVAPDGVEWRVRVRWQPRWPALVRRVGAWWRGGKGNPLDPPAAAARTAGDTVDAAADGTLGSLTDEFVAVGIAIAVLIAVGGLIWWLVIPVLLLVVDAALVVVLLVSAVPTRVLLRRPWQVEAATSGRVVTVDVVGWRAALRTRDQLAAQLCTGPGRAARCAGTGPTG